MSSEDKNIHAVNLGRSGGKATKDKHGSKLYKNLAKKRWAEPNKKKRIRQEREEVEQLILKGKKKELKDNIVIQYESKPDFDWGKFDERARDSKDEE